MLILLRLSPELTIKSAAVRSRFQSRLIENIRDCLNKENVQNVVRNKWSRITVETPDPRAVLALRHVFGISSYSVVEKECSAELDDIVATGLALYQDGVKGKSFAVRAHRSGAVGYRSIDVNEKLGAALRPFAAKTDLRKPEVLIQVELRPEGAFFFRNRIDGAGGLPLGASGKSICLFSGGFDSPVAAWMMLRRGLGQEYVLCNVAGPAYERSVLRVAKVLAEKWSHGHSSRFHTVDFGPIVENLRTSVNKSEVQVILKRLFLRAAEMIANECRAEAIVTGEAVGQVSSQTVTNLRAIEDVTLMPVLRPVVGFEKAEIIARAAAIGTYDMSRTIQEYCQLVPDKPNTHCSVALARREEAKCDLELLKQVVAERKVTDLKKLRDADLVDGYVVTDQVPEGAQLIDCRDQEQFEHWHPPHAKLYPFTDLLKDFAKLPKEQVYVIYCPFGMQSAVIAERMQGAGYQAYSLRGGTATLRRICGE